MDNNKIMVRINKDPEPKPSVRVAGMPLFIPKDTITHIKINDTRKINPATGLPLKNIGTKTVDADAEVVKRIIAHAKAQGQDPYTALAISLQENNLGKDDDNYGHVYGKDNWGKVPKDIPDLDQNAYALVRTLKDKLNIAKSFGYDKKGEAHAIQAYNGYGNLYPQTEAGYHGGEQSAFYGIPVTKENPLRLSENPAYGKTIISLRDEILKKSPDINSLIERTEPFKMPDKVLIKIKK